MELLIIAAVVVYVLFHGRHYRRHRRGGLTVRESIPGPFRTWFTISKRF